MFWFFFVKPAVIFTFLLLQRIYSCCCTSNANKCSQFGSIFLLPIPMYFGLTKNMDTAAKIIALIGDFCHCIPWLVFQCLNNTAIMRWDAFESLTAVTSLLTILVALWDFVEVIIDENVS